MNIQSTGPETLQRARGGSMLSAFALAGCLALCAPMAAAQDFQSPIERAGESIRAQYRQDQWARLAESSNRDDLIAALLIGLPNEAGPGLVSVSLKVESRLREKFGADPLALYSLALACQAVGQACRETHYQSDLVRIAPENAFHWLVSVQGVALSESQLARSASAPRADSHARELTRIIRQSLEAPAAELIPSGFDRDDLAMYLRVELADRIPHPDFSPIGTLCRTPAEMQRAGCVALGHLLIADESGLVVSRMVGSAMVRRLQKGTEQAEAATELRREYVWLSDNWGTDELESKEAQQIDMLTMGEMAAWQRSLERSGLPAKPPVGWLPKDPRHMQLHEDRLPAGSDR